MTHDPTSTVARPPASTHLAFPDQNPFRADAVRPGALTFRMPAESQLDLLVDRFVRAGGRGQIVGPHGSGKSTLVRTLLPLLARHFASVESFRVDPTGRAQRVRDEEGSGESLRAASEGRAGMSTVSFDQLLASLETAPALLVIDGFEAWSGLRRSRLLRRCNAGGCGLLVTTHRRLRVARFRPWVPGRKKLPELHRMQPDYARFCEVVQSCCPEPPDWWQPHWVRQAYDRHAPNLREALFELYDCYEQGRRADEAHEMHRPGRNL